MLSSLKILLFLKNRFFLSGTVSVCVCVSAGGGMRMTGGKQLIPCSVTPVPLHLLPWESHCGSFPWLSLKWFTSLTLQTDELCDRTSAVSAENQLFLHDRGSAPFSPLPTRTSESDIKDSLGLIRRGWIVKNPCNISCTLNIFFFLTFC